MSESRPATALRHLGAALTLGVGIVHIQQWDVVLKNVPTVGTLFVLNAVGAGVLVAALAFRPLRVFAALGAIGLSVGALVSVLIALTSSLFDYTEPALRAAVTVSIALEIAAALALAGYLLLVRRDSSA